MRRVYVDNLKGTEILAKPIYTQNDMILLSQGIRVKRSYVGKLKELGIDYIYIEDALSEGIEIEDFIDERTREACKKEVRHVLEKFSTSGRVELDSIAQVAESVIEDILSNKEVVVNISDIRREDEYTYSHSVNVCSLSVLTALKRGYSPEKARDLAIGALLHDLGKVLIPDDILNKEGNLTPQENEILKQHVIHGYEAVKDEVWLSAISKVVILTHHERLDGSGYPFGWTGDKIHDSAKIVGLCDVFDTMTNKYGNRAAYKIYEVIEYLTAMKGILFDEDIVNTFTNYIAVFPSGSGVITNKGDICIVLKQNKDLPTRPVLRLVKNNQGENYEVMKELDLSKETTTFIVDTYEL
jgi:HD-GYP domain-containing protein (c-di-GMP phosphodiesterase class II)